MPINNETEIQDCGIMIDGVRGYLGENFRYGIVFILKNK